MKKVILVYPATRSAKPVIDVLKTNFRWFHCIQTLPSLKKISILAPTLIVVNADLYEQYTNQIFDIIKSGYKVLVYGQSWSDEKQVNAYTQGVSGYCREDASPNVLLEAVNNVLDGKVWIEENLVSAVIDTFRTQIQNDASQIISKDALQRLLTDREMEVAQHLKTGEKNREIAKALNISERTVKAHLSSIFNKLNIADRLHLVIYLQQIGI